MHLEEKGVWANLGYLVKRFVFSPLFLSILPHLCVCVKQTAIYH